MKNKNENKKKKSYKAKKIVSLLLALLTGALLLIYISYDSLPPKGAIHIEGLETINYSKFEEDIDARFISCIYYSEGYEYIYLKRLDGTYCKMYNPEMVDPDNRIVFSEITYDDLIVQSAIEFYDAQQPQTTTIDYVVALVAISVCTTFVVFYLYYRVMDSDGEGENGPATACVGGYGDDTSVDSQVETPTKTFKDVAGLYEVKKDMRCLVDFLKNNERYASAGARLPKGVIFYGPPGTGKTLLAKAIAGEAGVPFHYMSGSDFVEKFVGVGAKRVRELFANAKKQTPCIIFIDEIDAIGSRRSSGDSNSEDRKTINALLTEMDGFNESENIIVIAATNRLEDLDSALVRPGRFTNKFCVPLPETPNERLEIIRLYAKNKKFAEDVDFHALAKETTGFSPAAIESLLNESAIISVQDDKKFIDRASIEKAMFKVLLSGHVKENQADRDKRELELVAWHEAGHALVGKLNGKSIPKVTVLASTSGAGGVTFTTPKSVNLYSVDDLKAEVSELYAGRIAELMLLKDKSKVTTGASNDIQKATNIIRSLVTSYGMSDEFGMLNLEQLQIGQATIIEHEVKLAKEIEAQTTEMLAANYDCLKAIAEALLAKETLYESDLESILAMS